MKKDIIYTALENFQENTLLSVKVNFENLNTDNPIRYDGAMLIESLTNSSFNIEVKQNLTLSKASSISSLPNKKETVFISDYIPKSMKEFLRKEKYSYIDGAGNAFIIKDNLFIFIETNKNLRNAFQSSNRSFSKSGLKVIYQLLTNPEIINMPYRDIGKRSKVSIDTVSKVFKELLKAKYIIKVEEKEYKIANKENLISEWVTFYNKILRPKLKQRKYNIKQENLSNLSKVCHKETLGGELAGELLTNYLIAENAIIYTDLAFVDVMKEFKLIPSPDGNVTLIEKFWNTVDMESEKICVHPLLVYADLLNDPRPRNIETANLIYKDYVQAIV